MYKNKIFSITIYKNSYCITNLSLSTQEIDFGDCYEKVQNYYKINDDIVIAIVNGLSFSTILTYSMYDPNMKEDIDEYNLCKDDNVILKENLLNKLEKNNINIYEILFLTEQNIDIFNRSSSFYNDICFYFDSHVNKDINL